MQFDVQMFSLYKCLFSFFLGMFCKNHKQKVLPHYGLPYKSLCDLSLQTDDFLLNHVFSYVC